MNTTNNSSYPLINLVGSLENIFHELGKIDAVDGKKLLFRVNSLLGVKNRQLNTFFTTAQAVHAEYFKKNNPSFAMLVEAYAEGAKLNSKIVLSSLLVPEFLTSLPRLTVSKVFPFLGCSTLVNQDEFLRILDFPLGEEFRNHERCLKISPDGKNQLISFNSAGIPFLGLTALNEHSISISVHQKFASHLSLKGQSIFDISQKILLESRDLLDAEKIINDSVSIGTWGLNIKQGQQFLKVEISGNKKNVKKYDLHESSILVLNENQIPIDKPIFPYGIEFYNASRRRFFQNNLSNKPLSLEALYQSYDFDPRIERPLISGSSIGIYALNKSAVSVVSKSILHQLENPFNNDHFIKKSLLPLKEYDLLGKIEAAQMAIDSRDTVQAYHHFQTAIRLSENSAYEAKLRFFFVTLQFQNQKNQLVLKELNQELRKILPQLSNYHQQLARLFIFRIDKLTDSIDEKNILEINNPHILSLLKKEKLIPLFIYKRIIQSSYVTRIDIEDVVHFH